MLLGVYIGQYCITTITYFFLTWFPVYLVEQRHVDPRRRRGRVLAGGLRLSRRVLGGSSDWLLKRGYH